jgi:type 1 fimbria pilin
MTINWAGAARSAGSQWKRFAARYRWVVAVAAIGVAAAGSLAFRAAGDGGSHQGAAITRNGEIRLQGTITRDSCWEVTQSRFPLGDFGCFITVNGYEVAVVPGNTVPVGEPGPAPGLDVFKNQAGWQAVVFAKLTGSHSASILSAPKYYARISGAAIIRNGEIRLQGKITRDNCWDVIRARLPVGDFGCFITVNGYQVAVVPGNTRPVGEPGPAPGLDVVRNQAGWQAVVFAKLTGSHSASVLSAPKYYARISSAAITRNGEIRLQGKITRDNCWEATRARLPVGDFGCSITVNGYQVALLPGNTRPVGKPGSVTGLDVVRNQAGWQAVVFAKLTGPRSASILSAPKYGAAITRSGEIRLQGKITRDNCWESTQARIPVGDGSCFITVNGYEVTVLPVSEPRSVAGLDLFKNQTGWQAVVFAKLTGPHSASIVSAPRYYARISR